MLREEVHVHRLGAMGDIIMSLCAVVNLRKRYKKIIYHTSQHQKKILENFLLNFVDKVVSDEEVPWGEENFVNFYGYRPPHPLFRDFHLIEDFCDEANVDFNLEMPAIDLPCCPSEYSHHEAEGKKNTNITIQSTAGWSKYKEYSQWDEVINLAKRQSDKYKFFQIGGPNDKVLENVDGSFLGKSFDENLAAQAHADLHLGIDSSFQHTTNLNWIGKKKTKAIIFFGSTHPKTFGYENNVNIFANLKCQPCNRENKDMTINSTVPTTECPFVKDDQAACSRKITPNLIVEYIKLYT